jgi:Otopetrin
MISRIDETSDLLSLECPGPEDLNTIYRNFAPYLYPFIIEFCILIVGIFYMIWSNINHCPKKLASAKHAHDSHGSHHGNGRDSTLFTSLGPIPEDGFMPSGSIVQHAPPSESEYCKIPMEHENQYKSNIVVYADCHASSRGLFGKSL